jgi:2-polyprenyl-6-hydroxyphenyl methylase/3-demethylubiquinone-9 3-methyltransferase
MDSGLQAVCADQAPCKCCGTTAFLCGVVDFNKNCEIHRRQVLGISGVPIYYYRCAACRFVFTTAFDDFTKDDFLRYVYNEEYLLIDPDYLGPRARASADTLVRLFPDGRRPRRVLDYGGGNGTLAEHLRAAGFPAVETYDPFVSVHSDRPAGRFDCVLCVEVVEHSTDPGRTFADMIDFLDDPGLILFSTLLQPPDIDRQGLNWWYAAPRNGHVSLFSRESLQALLGPFGLGLASFNDSMHALFRGVPEFAKPFLVPADRYAPAEPYATTVVTC